VNIQSKTIKKALVLAVVLPLLASGCAVDMFRTAAVNVARLEVASFQSNGLTSVLAGDLFRNVANQLGFIVKGPIKLSQFSNYSVEYTADVPVAEPKNNISLAMLIDEKQISFVANVYGTKEDFATATNAASLFQRELDKRGIQYKVFYGKRMYP
jgi:hypothetical protein